MIGCNTLTLIESELLHPIRTSEKGRTELLLRRLFAVEHVTRFDRGGGIDRDVSFVDVPDDAFFIDHEGGTVAEALLLVEDAIILDDGTFEIA